MKELLAKFENKQPEIVFEWKDAETEAEGWVVINSLRGGAAGGGGQPPGGRAAPVPGRARGPAHPGLGSPGTSPQGGGGAE